MSELDDAYRARQVDLQNDVARTLRRILQTITLARMPQVRAWYAWDTARTVADGQWGAGELALWYLAALGVKFDEPPDLQAAFKGVLKTATSPGMATGLVRMWWLLDEGAPEEEAREQAGIFTAGLAEGDLQAAMRIGLDEGARVSRGGMRWRKNAGPSACAWCQEISGASRYLHAYTVPMHRACKCGVSVEYVELGPYAAPAADVDTLVEELYGLLGEGS